MMDITKKAKIDVIKSFMQFYGGFKINLTTYNYNDDGGIRFTGTKENGDSIYVVMDKYQVEAIQECETIEELHDVYIEMEFFWEVEKGAEG